MSPSAVPKGERKSIRESLKEKGVPAVDWAAYRRIDAEERSASRKRNDLQPREKICIRDEQLEFAFSD